MSNIAQDVRNFFRRMLVEVRACREEVAKSPLHAALSVEERLVTLELQMQAVAGARKSKVHREIKDILGSDDPFVHWTANLGYDTIVISGVPSAVEDEELKNVVRDLASKVGVVVRRWDVDMPFRWPASNGPPTVVTHFISRAKKDELMARARVANFDSRMIGVQPPMPIEIEDYTGQSVNGVLQYALAKRVANALDYLGVSQNKLVICKRQGMVYKNVRTEADINAYLALDDADLMEGGGRSWQSSDRESDEDDDPSGSVSGK